MKAVVCTKYGSAEVLKIKEIAQPIPEENELLIQVYNSSITTADSMMRQGTPRYARLFLGLNKPRHAITGTGFSGKVVSIGKHVKKFKNGDLVFGETALGFGTNAEYIRVKEDGTVLKKADQVSTEETACMCDGPLTSYNFLFKQSELKQGDRILIIGASGSLGSAAVQLALHAGAHVTGVCSTKHVEFVKSLGAQRVIDYKKETYTLEANPYDLIYDTAGKSSFGSCRYILKPGGTYLSPVLSLKLMLQMLRTSIAGKRKAKFSATGMLPPKVLLPMLKELHEMMVDGKLTNYIDRSFPMEHIAEAHRCIDEGRKKGNLVLSHT